MGCDFESEMKNEMDGAMRIQKERLRQIEEEGWTQEHDLIGNNDGQCARAAACYAVSSEERGNFNTIGSILSALWPWEEMWFKPCPKNRIHELEKAGALIAAEIDRLLAIDNKQEEANHG
jgi:hypothetical protein